MATPKADKALERAAKRAEFRKSIIDASSASQVKIARERGRQRRSVEKAKSVQRANERVASERARQETIERRAILQQESNKARSVQRVQTQKDLAAVNREAKVKNQILQSAASPAIGATKSISSTLFLIVTIFFTLIIMYVVILNANNFGGFLSGAGNFIQGLSSNKPLFLKTENLLDV